jgi:hypothetical protein
MKKPSSAKSRGTSQDRKLVSEQVYEKSYEAKKMNVSVDAVSKAKSKAGTSRKAIEKKLKG